MNSVHPRFHGSYRPLVVGDEGGIASPGTAPDLRHDFLGVPELGDGLRVDERGDLDSREAGVREEADDLDLELGRDERRLDLEPVPGSHLADGHALR